MVVVLVFCFILMPVAATFAQASRLNLRSAGKVSRLLEVEFMMDGLADVVASRLAFDRQFAKDISNMPACKIADLAFAVSFQDHHGKIDLNNSSSDLLQVGFEAIGMATEQSRLMQEYVEASRSSIPPPRDLEDVPNLPPLKNARFERVEELYDVTQALGGNTNDLDTYFTTYTKSGNLNLSVTKGRLRDLLEKRFDVGGISDAENADLEYIDVLIDGMEIDGRSTGLRKTYRRVDQIHSVQLVKRKRFMSGASIATLNKADARNCLDLLRTTGGVHSDD